MKKIEYNNNRNIIYKQLKIARKKVEQIDPNTNILYLANGFAVMVEL